MMMFTEATMMAVLVSVSQTNAMQVRMDIIEPERRQQMFRSVRNQQKLMSVRHLDDLDAQSNQADDTEQSSKEVNMQQISEFHKGDKVDICGFKGADSCPLHQDLQTKTNISSLDGLVGRLVRAQNYDDQTWIIKFHPEDQKRVPLTDKIKTVIGKQTSKYASDELKNATKDRDAMAIHEENMISGMHVGDKVMLGRYTSKFDKHLNGLVGVITRAHEHECWIVQIPEAETLPEEVRQHIREQTSGMASAEFKAEMANGDKLSVHEHNMKKTSTIARYAEHPRVMDMLGVGSMQRESDLIRPLRKKGCPVLYTGDFLN